MCKVCTVCVLTAAVIARLLPLHHCKVFRGAYCIKINACTDSMSD
jgi:hypothetical protein